MRRPPIDPVVWQPGPVPARARQTQGSVAMPPPRLLDLLGIGAEDVAVDRDGRIVCGVADGRILRLSSDGRWLEVVADTLGRPMGVEVDADGTLVVCDCTRGLLRVHPVSGRVEVLVAADTSVEGRPLLLCNNSTIGAAGTIWFSDSSGRFTQPFWKADLLEHSGTGRLLRRDVDGRVDVVATGLHFANGVALAPDESFVVVAESAAYRLTRVWLTGPQNGRIDALVEDLPGFPDNIAVGSDGLLWVAVGSPRNAALDFLSPRHPLLRKAVWALPDALQPKPANTAWVQAFSFDGTLVHDFQATIDGFSMVTGVREHAGVVWMGNLHSRSIAAFDLPG